MIVVTGGPTTDRAIEFLSSIASRVVMKPFAPDDLRRRVGAVAGLG